MKAGLEVHVNDFRSIKSEILFEDLNEIRKYAEKNILIRVNKFQYCISLENEMKRL